MPMLVTPALLPRAVAAASSTMQTSIIAGPALGGALYALGPTVAARLGHAGEAAYWGAAVVYGVSLLLLIVAIAARSSTSSM